MRQQRSRALAHGATRRRCLLGWALATGLWWAIGPVSVPASPVAVEHVSVSRVSGQWRFSVTLRHGDTGWDHYAIEWIVESESGEVLGRRVLLHPHVDEQPFTRSRTMALPPDMRTVRVRAKDNQGGFDSNVVVVHLDQAQGPRFDVRR